MKLIDKDALVAEIERWIDELNFLLPDACNIGKYTILKDFRKYVDTLEVKEVDLKKNIDSWYYHLNIPENYTIPQTIMVMDIIEKTAQHFFELGLKAQKGAI